MRSCCQGSVVLALWTHAVLDIGSLPAVFVVYFCGVGAGMCHVSCCHCGCILQHPAADSQLQLWKQVLRKAGSVVTEVGPTVTRDMGLEARCAPSREIRF